MKKKLRLDRILMVAILFLVVVFVLIYIFVPKKQNKMINLLDKDIIEIKEYASDNNLKLTIKEENNPKPKGSIVEQNIKEGSVINKEDDLIIIISKGIDYTALKVNELGNVPIMMYHGIHNVTDNKYTGGNVDKDGYQRTSEAFRKDLDFYYEKGYRMIRLEDYIHGKIDVKAGLSPLVITFDDGLENNMKITGLDEQGNLIIDPNSAVGILEEYKQKYSDFNVTATFFINGGIFNQNEYNEKILKWLVEHGYDVGNHSNSHPDFTKITEEKSVEEIGKVYNILEKYIPGKYVNIVALPFGSPYNKTNANFSKILAGTYNGKAYETECTLRVGWESEVSPFSKSFDKTFLKRIRAYDNNGKEFDIAMNFKNLEGNKYISDGDSTSITVSKDKESKVNNPYDLKVNTY